MAGVEFNVGDRVMFNHTLAGTVARVRGDGQPVINWDNGNRNWNSDGSDAFRIHGEMIRVIQQPKDNKNTVSLGAWAL